MQLPLSCLVGLVPQKATNSATEVYSQCGPLVKSRQLQIIKDELTMHEYDTGEWDHELELPCMAGLVPRRAAVSD